MLQINNTLKIISHLRYYTKIAKIVYDRSMYTSYNSIHSVRILE